MQDPRIIDPALRRKYDVQGPRYTSYPPANHFGPIALDELFNRWNARNDLAHDPGLSLYLHVPFCRTRCLFCGCHSIVSRDTDEMDRYVTAVLSEMELAATKVNPRRPVVQVALGGGTPNALSEAQIDRLLSGMAETWAIQPRAELSVEVDPRTATPQKLDAFLRHGFNRFSLGVQDLDRAVLAAVRRGQDLMQVEEVVSHLRRAGCWSVNFDLIYGLPHQDERTAAATAREVIRMRPSRIALYGYAHVPWIKPHQKTLETSGLPGAGARLSIFLLMMDLFAEAGYASIGMDHFALPNDPLARALRTGTLRRNFMGYTTARGTDLLAFGVSGISSIGASYSQNQKDTSRYEAAIAAGDLPVERGFFLSRDDEVRRELILELFCNFSVDLSALGAQFGLDAERYLAEDIARLSPLIDDGLVQVTPNTIRVSEVGRFFIRNICMTFDRYLEPVRAALTYSRTI